MTNEQLLVMSQLSTELYNARQEIERLKSVVGNTKDYSEELKHLGQTLEVTESVAKGQRECKEKAEKERDEARQKLGEWARFINFTVYERLDQFVMPKNTPKAVVNLIEAVCNSIEQFRIKHPITIIEGGLAK